jgi:diguanylate cyclase (GGDEF)-like protein
MVKQRSTASINWVIAGITAILLAIVATTTYSVIYNDKRSTLNDAAARITQYAIGAEVALNRSLLSVDMLLAGLGELFLSANIDIAAAKVPAQLQRGERVLRDMADQSLLVRETILLDSEGGFIMSSDSSHKRLGHQIDPAFIAELKSSSARQMRISAPSVLFSTSEVVLYFGRTTLFDNRPVITVACVPVAQLSSALTQGAEVEGLEITYESADGRLLVSSPANQAKMGKRIEPALDLARLNSNNFNITGRLSGQPVLMAARKTVYQSAYTTASQSQASILNNWVDDSWITVIIATMISGLILLFAFLTRSYLYRILDARSQLAESSATLDKALDAMSGGFILVDAKDNIVRWNQRLFEYYPWLKDTFYPNIPFRETLAATAKNLFPKATDIELDTWICKRMQQHLSTNTVDEQVMPNGRLMQVVENKTPDGGYVCLYWDVTERKAQEQAIAQLAYYDPLTKLPNRRLFAEFLDQSLALCQAHNTYAALLYIDLDDFKTLNDTFGHQKGDRLLEKVATRLASCVRSNDKISRLGGDEFVVILNNLGETSALASETATELSQLILQTLSQAYDIEGALFRSTPSIGVVLFNSSTDTADGLMRQSDIAMYAAKNAGRNTVRFFDPQMQLSVESRSLIEKELMQAIPNQQFRLFYQMQVDHDNTVIGVEALIRWQHPEKGLVRPIEFIGVAEASGQIVAIGYWVIKTACEQLHQWQSMPTKRHLRISINVSARQFRQPDFVQRFKELIGEYPINPNLLELELTESLVMDNLADARSKMHELKQLGIRFSMDDFGIGHSSLATLRKLPFDQIKIDQSFIADLLTDKDDAVIVETIIAMAGSLQMDVIAEGVESAEQLAYLLRYGCDYYQGFYFSQPLAITAFDSHLQDWFKQHPQSPKIMSLTT